MDPNETEQKPDAPLSAEALAALAKARRSFAFSIGILLLGFMAIAFALVYRVLRDRPAPTIAAEVSLPAGAEVISALLSDGQINVTYVVDGVTRLALFDQGSGEKTRELVLGE
ncbi:hypothetical protein SAMN05428969_2074 [Devosia sp. YR412]|nr:hypothetical protein SAMN05428969_2074 [Devosia sp. YR412]